MNKEEVKKITVIFSNTYDDAWGTEIEIFGIADNDLDIDKICERVSNEGYEPCFEELPINEYCRKYLGGYYE